MPLIIGVEHAQVVQRLQDNNVILRGHFELSSGRHSDQYLDKRLFMNEMEEEFDRYCEVIAGRIVSEGYGAIVAPEAAGVMVAERVLKFIRRENPRIGYAPARKNISGLRIDPADRLQIAGRCVAVIEDVITTGETAVRVCELARSMSASVNSIYCLFERGYHGKVKGLPVHAVVQVDLPDWEPPCRLCKQGIPLSLKPMGGSSEPTIH